MLKREPIAQVQRVGVLYAPERNKEVSLQLSMAPENEEKSHHLATLPLKSRPPVITIE